MLGVIFGLGEEGRVEIGDATEEIGDRDAVEDESLAGGCLSTLVRSRATQSLHGRCTCDSKCIPIRGVVQGRRFIREILIWI